MRKEDNSITWFESGECDALLRTFFNVFNDEIIAEVKQNLEWMTLKPGEILFEAGDTGKEVFVVLKGLLIVKIIEKYGEEIVLSKIGPKESVGEMSLLTRESRGATIEAEEITFLARLSRESFLKLSDKYPEIQTFFSDIISFRLRKSRFNFILPSLLGEMDHEITDKFVNEVEWVEIEGGNVLFSQGDPSDCVYFVISGHLSVWININDEVNQQKVGKIVKGESIGEMGLLTGEERGATVIANRDCVLAKLNQDLFYRITSEYPQLLITISRIIINRLKKVQTKGFKESVGTNIAVVYISPNIKQNDFEKQFVLAMQKIGDTLVLDSKSIGNQLGIMDINQSLDDNKKSRISILLEERELNHKFCVFFADPQATKWTQRCIRQADHLILIGDATDSSQPGRIENDLAETLEYQKFLKKTLVLIHPPETVMPSGTKQWLSCRDLSGQIHIRQNLSKDYERLTRIITGNAIALVLGGGGAKGMAHIGVIKALKEANIPIDITAGTSIGGVIAGMVAMDLTIENHEQLARDFVKNKPFGFSDITIPFISILKGKRIAKAFYDNLNYSIEDLWLNFFCVSTNISDNTLEVHREGSLPDAILASTALPAILPPKFMENKLLVDGGVMNNLPGDIMRELYDCKLITIDLGGDAEIKMDHPFFPNSKDILKNRFIPGRQQEHYPGLFEILIRSITVGSSRLSKQVREMADLSIELPIENFNSVNLKLVEKSYKVAYEFTKKKLNELEDIDFFRSK